MSKKNTILFKNLFLHTPGLHVVVPSSPYEAKGLLAASIRSRDPVLFFEPKRIYRSIKEEVPEEECIIPLGKANISRKGKDVTLIGWGAQHHQNLLAANELGKEGIEVEVIDLRSLNPLDRKTMISSVNNSPYAKIPSHRQAAMTIYFIKLLVQLV